MRHHFKRVSALLLAAVLCITLITSSAAPAFAAGSGTFADVPAGAWYATQVEAAAQAGLINGTSANTFSPLAKLHVNEAVTLAVQMQRRSLGLTDPLTSTSGPWYQAFTDYAKENGIIDETWDPLLESALCTRGQFARILYAALDPAEAGTVNSVPDNSIPDVTMDMEEGEAVYALYRMGASSGGDGHKFMPADTLTRAEAAVFLYNVVFVDDVLASGSFKPFSLTAKTMPVMPAYDAEITVPNILAVLEHLDPDGAYIIKSAMDGGDSERDVLAWFKQFDDDDLSSSNVTFTGDFGDFDDFSSLMGDGVILDDLSTAVHEECHSYIMNPGWKQNRYYTGSGRSVLVTFTDVFDSSEIDSVIPESLKEAGRTYFGDQVMESRYDTYVNGETADPNMASIKQGVYGLMNEYTAYCWGTVNSLRTYDYEQENAANDGPFTTGSSDEWVSQAEFRYFILTYMLYAKDHHPDVYKGIMNNKDFLAAFKAVDDVFEATVSQLQAKKAAANKDSGLGSFGDQFFSDLFESWGIEVGTGNGIGAGLGHGSYSQWTDPFQDQYDAYAAELAKPEYVEMLALMKA